MRRDPFEPIVCPQCRHGDIDFWPNPDDDTCECECLECRHKWTLDDFDEYAEERAMDADDTHDGAGETEGGTV